MAGVLATIANHQWYCDQISDSMDNETKARFKSQTLSVPTLETTLSQKKLDVPQAKSKSSNGESQQEEVNHSDPKNWTDSTQL